MPLPASSDTDTASSVTSPRALARRVALLAVLLALAVAALVWLPALEPVRDRFANTDGGWVAVAAVLQLASVLSFVAAFRGAFEQRIGWRAAFDLAAVEQGANIVLPSGGSGGIAVGAVILVRAGVPTSFAVSRSAVLFLTTSAASFAAVILAGIGEAVGLLPGHASLASTLLPAAGAALVLVAVVALSLRVPLVESNSDQRLRSLLHRLQTFLRGAVSTTLTMIRDRNWLLVGGSLGYLAFDVASLGAAFRALGADGPPLGTFTLAYVLGHAGALIPVPGSAEGGLVGSYAAYGTPVSLAIGAVLIYRTFHAGVPILLGIAGYLDVRRLRLHGASREEVARRFPSEPD